MVWRRWRPTCACQPGVIGVPVSACETCGAAGVYEGLALNTVELWGKYSRLTGLRPFGEHRSMANELLSFFTTCKKCRGVGWLDAPEGCYQMGEPYPACPDCFGVGAKGPSDPEAFERLSKEIIDKFPAAAPKQERLASVIRFPTR